MLAERKVSVRAMRGSGPCGGQGSSALSRPMREDSPAARITPQKLGAPAIEGKISRATHSSNACPPWRPTRALSKAALVRRRSIDGRHRNVVQAQIDAELGAMVNQVIHHEAAHHGNFRQGHEG